MDDGPQSERPAAGLRCCAAGTGGSIMLASPAAPAKR